MTYIEYINSIISSRGQWNIGANQYFEGHHIIPKCLGGTGNPRKKDANIIWLYPEEHYIAHKLLAEENPDNKKIALAWSMMIWPHGNDGRQYKVSAEDYARCKRLMSRTLKNHMVSDSSRKKMSESQKKRFENLEERKRAGSCHIGVKLTDEHKKKISKANHGKKWSSESREAAGIKIYCVELNKIYNSGAEAFREVKKIDQNETAYKNGSQNILLACRGIRKSAYGLHWKFADDVAADRK